METKGEGEQVRTLRDLRELRGLTLEDLAQKTGYCRSYMHYIENGKRRLSLDLADRLANILSINLDSVQKLYVNSKKNKN